MEYKQHPRFDKYLIREDGLIFSKQTGKELFKQKNNSGYWISHFYVNSKRVAGTIHRVIAETWVNNPENKPQVNHIDGDKENCHPNNLQWVTASENIIHSFSTGLSENTREKARERMKVIGLRNIECKTKLLIKYSSLKKKPICMFSLDGILISEFDSIRSARSKGFNHVGEYLKNGNNKYKGYLWFYKDAIKTTS